MKFIPIFILIVITATIGLSQKKDYKTSMNDIAERYVRLVLAIGQHDADYVDAYYGPKEWRDDVVKMNYQLTALKDQTNALLARLKRMRVPRRDTDFQLRRIYLTKQLSAALTKIEMLSGTKYSFDEEAKRLYDAAPPKYSEKHFIAIIRQLEKLLPAGTGTVEERYEAFKKDFIIPKEKLDTVFTSAINECRNRTKQFITLPEKESFVVEYVTGKAWSGYNWYKGDAHSVIQVNTDFPIFIDRAIDLAAHEGYPGHHVYNALLEAELLKKKGWIEFCVYPLFSPQSLIAEGSANYGIDVVLPKKERLKFEKEVLFPLAGLDSSKVEQYYKVQDLVAQLNYAGNEAARNYLNGDITKEQAIDWLVKYGLFEAKRAEQRVRFIEKYRAYIINYNLGQDLVKKYVEKKSGKKPTQEKKWNVFTDLLSSPRMPDGLR